jgi:hypothetical protein
LRLVGEKMKEKDKKMISAPTTYSESLQVCDCDWEVLTIGVLEDPTYT